jgi:hypothetical protein
VAVARDWLVRAELLRNEAAMVIEAICTVEYWYFNICG